MFLTGRVELEVRERAWVADECLRGGNAIIAIDELRIPPEQALRGADDHLLAGEPFIVSAAPVHVGRTSVAMHRGRGVISWSANPLTYSDEQVVLAICEEETVVRRIALGRGADAQCAALNDELYTCWSRRSHDDPQWSSLHVWRESTSRTAEVATVNELISPAFLILWEHAPAVVYLAGGRTLPLTLSVVALADGTADHLEIGSAEALLHERTAVIDQLDGNPVELPTPSVRVGGLSVAHAHGKALALVHGVFSGRLFALTDSWRSIDASWPFGRGIANAEISIIGGRGHCVANLLERGIYSAIADLALAEWSKPIRVAANGWHPSCIAARGRRLAAWTGGPPLPLGVQDDSAAPGNTMRWIAIDTAPGAWPLTALWIGVFDEQARCVGHLGRLGYLGHTARWPQLDVDYDGRGLLLWELGDEDRISLVARWLQA